MYHVSYTPQAIKELKKIDKHTRTLILAWIEKNLIGCIDPRQHGKGLIASHKGKWRYRVGDYRLISEIQDDKVIILVINIGHRKDIYS